MLFSLICMKSFISYRPPSAVGCSWLKASRLNTENLTPPISTHRRASHLKSLFFFLPPSLPNCSSVFKEGMVSPSRLLQPVVLRSWRKKAPSGADGPQSLGSAGGSTGRRERPPVGTSGSPSVMCVLRLLPGGHCKPKAMLSVQALNNLQS